MSSAKSIVDARRLRKEGDLIWAEQIHQGGGRRFYYGSLSVLRKQLNALPEEERIREEVYCKSEPARLFYDVDGDGLTHDEAETILEELFSKTDEALEELFGLVNVKRWVLDASSPVKQSRHIYYDAVFESLNSVRQFVDIVLDRCTIKTGKNKELVCAVDRGKYLTALSSALSTSNLRLPGCRKLGKEQPFTIVPGGEPFIFEKCMVNVLHDSPDRENLLTVPDAAVISDKRARVDDGEESRVTTDAYNRVVEWLSERANDKPYVLPVHGNTIYCSVKGMRCRAAGKVHKSNKMGFHVYVARGNRVEAWFTCFNDDCNRGAVRVEEDLFPVFFPAKAKEMMEKCWPSE